ncbi:hypothetical protein BDZ88DRAFT_451119 [Geranomyces variabilis]|nr:hypothetical protein BDZ88DRAFT_451119 [Geranomyces variabilis]KAJ3141054.1 hypothetical protein HDU90_007077 [Geranomyces variabilis]
MANACQIVVPIVSAVSSALVAAASAFYTQRRTSASNEKLAKLKSDNDQLSEARQNIQARIGINCFDERTLTTPEKNLVVGLKHALNIIYHSLKEPGTLYDKEFPSITEAMGWPTPSA